MRKTYKGKKAPAGYHFMPGGKLMKDSAHKKAGGSVRNYKGEYANYQSSEEQKKKRASRNAARRKMAAVGKVKKGDGKDVTHRDGNPRNNSSKNLGVLSKSKNRSYRRTKTAGKAQIK